MRIDKGMLFDKERLVTGGLLLVAVTALVVNSYGQKNDEEAQDYFRKWLKEDVIYIIQREEKEVFESLSTIEEKEGFIEQFWRRRDPAPRTFENEFKEEHYRRITYANEKFASGFPGWRTDRGMIYIKYGPPDDITGNPTGGTYTREFYEGGGTTSTYPFEIWWYRHIEGIEQGVEIEFVDPLSSGEFRMAHDQFEKDALFHMGGGETMWEGMGLVSRRELIKMRGLGNPSNSYIRSTRRQDQPLERLHRLTKLLNAPPIRFDDLKTLVETRVSYQQVPVRVASHAMTITDEISLVSVTASIKISTENFVVAGDSLWLADVNVYGRVTNLGGKIVYEFDDDLTIRWAVDPTERSHPYQRKIPLKPGRYKLTLVAREAETEKIGTVENLIMVPENTSDLTALLILAEKVIAARSGASLTDPFVVMGDLKIYPSVNRVFSSSDLLRVYLEVHNLWQDMSTRSANFRLSYKVFSVEKSLASLEKELEPRRVENDTLVNAAFAIPLNALEAGKYIFQMQVSDLISNKNLVLTDTFQVR